MLCRLLLSISYSLQHFQCHKSEPRIKSKNGRIVYNIYESQQLQTMNKKQKETINDICKQDKENFQDDLLHQFACECGKHYKTFPALYLHFQRSHKIKISTNIKDQFCISSKKGNIRTFTYYYSNKNLKLIGRTENQSLLYKLLDEFTESIDEQWDRYPALFLCSNFHKYLLQQDSFSEQEFEISRAFEIPNHFNGFMMENSQLMRTQDVYNYNCEILMRLARWLNFKGFSDLKVQLNQNLDANTQIDGVASHPQNSTGVL